jgi:phosphoribosylanthranilate isomerase
MTLLVKVCGLTNGGDAEAARAAGADLLGFVSHPPSPRHCADLGAAGVVRERAVLVVVGEAAGPMMALARGAGITRVQPHVSREHRGEVAAALRAAGFWVLLPWADEPDQTPIPADLYLWEPSPAATGVAGGSGQVHGMHHPPPGPFLLAGGLGADNLAARLAEVPEAARPLLRGVDAASRLERAPGLKESERVRTFVKEAHAHHL